MCGHVGIFGKNLVFQHRNFFEQALYADALRGMHGTGVCSVRNDRKTTVVLKKAMPSHDFMGQKAFDSLFVGGVASHCAVMGHNRHATKGAINHINSHPFQFDNITLMHNGSLKTQHQLPDSKDYDVDSENIAFAVAKDGIEATTPKLNGSYSLVWHDAENETINFVRNSERPMFIAKLKNTDNFIYASESLMLRWLAWRNDLNIEEMFQTDVGVWYSFNLRSMEMTTTAIEEYAPPVTQQNQGNVSRLPSPDNRRKGFSQEMFEELGLTSGQKVSCTIYSVEPYAGQRRGVIRGWMGTDPWNEVVAYGVDITGCEEGLDFSGNIIGFQLYSGKQNEGMIILKADTFQLDNDVVLEHDSVAEEQRKQKSKERRLKREEKKKNRKGSKSFENTDKMFTKQELDEGGRFAYHQVRKFRGPNGPVTGETFDNLTAQGCAHCTGNIYLQDHDEVRWNNSSPICPECVDQIDEFKSLEKGRLH